MRAIDRIIFCVVTILFVTGAGAFGQEEATDVKNDAVDVEADAGKVKDEAAEVKTDAEDVKGDASESKPAKPLDKKKPKKKPATKELPPPEDPYAPALKVIGSLKTSFGTAEKGDVKKVYFRIRNDGAGVLKIKDMTADCGCLQPTASRRQIEKGQEATIEVVVTTSIIEGEAEDKHIVVFSNDPRYPNGLQFHVVGTVVSTIGLRPERVVFDKVPFGESATRVIEMYETRNVGLNIEGAKTTSPFITVTYKPATIKAKFKVLDKKAKKVKEVERECPGFRIELVLSDEAQVGRVDQLLLIKTNYKPRKDFPPIRITGSVVGDFSYAPMNRIYIGGVRAGGRSTRRTLVVTSLADDFAVAKAEATSDEVNVKVQPPKGEKTRISVRVKGGLRPGPHRAFLRVYRNGDDERPIITIPIDWRVRGAGLAPVRVTPSAEDTENEEEKKDEE